jgi:hypothetical protein
MSETSAADQIGNSIDELLDSVPVLLQPEMDQETLHRFVEDVAQAIFEPKTIARRYGFEPPEQMVKFIAGNKEVLRRIKVRRAIWESDESIEVRARKLAGIGVLEGLPGTLNIIYDNKIGASTRLEALKAHTRIAGLDGLPKSDGSTPGPVGGRFSVNILFSGGKVESFTTVEKEPIAEVAAE